MLSYQHAYHAGNPADLHKHGILAGLLAALTVKPRGLTYMETHAGRGLYDLTGPEALKTGEAAFGVQRAAPGPGPLRQVLDKVRAAHGPSAYPGSPLIARTLLRPQDRLHLMELHPAEHAALKAALAAPNVAVHRRDGFEGVLALSPPDPRRGLVLVDPSYEVKTEYAAVADFVKKLLRRWPQAVVMIWYPLLPAGREADLIGGLGPLAKLRHEVRFAMREGHRMTGSGVVLVNAPHDAPALCDAAVAATGGLLRVGRET